MSFAVRPGRVTGFVGPNGAGKSTTMRVILGLASVDEGSALVGGRPYRGLRRPLCHLGSLLDATAPHPQRSARNHLLWLARSQGLATRRVDQVLERVGLAPAARRAAGGFSLGMCRLTVTGAGDLAPAVRETLPTGGTLKDLLTGTFAALLAVSVVGARYVTEEYRTNLIRLTLAASPRRARTLLAKAVVLGGVTFVVGLVGALAAAPLGERLARAHGVYLFPVASATGLRVALGTAALLALAAVLALALGTVLRHGAGAVTTVVVATALPYVLIANPFMPAGVADWLTRVTPAAAFAVQQTLVPYHQVAGVYTPYNGYFPLAPWAGLAVLAGYALVSLGVAAVVLRGRDA